MPVRCGEYLCVPATAGGIRVFGADYLFDLEKSRMGNPGGTERAGELRPVLRRPAVLRRVRLPVRDARRPRRRAQADRARRVRRGPVRFSCTGPDRSVEPDRLVSGEWCASNAWRGAS